MTFSTFLLSSSMSFLDHAPSTAPAALPVPVEITSLMLTMTTSQPASTTISSSSTLSAMMTTAATAAVTATAHNDEPSRPGANKGECELVGPFALFIQGALGALALLSLVYKRWRERPQRPIKIWAFDASKQVVGSILLHIANLLMSMLSSGQLTVTIATDRYQANPCSFYLLNLAIDVSSLQIPMVPSRAS